jgi:hypothetical protein
MIYSHFLQWNQIGISSSNYFWVLCSYILIHQTASEATLAKDRRWIEKWNYFCFLVISLLWYFDIDDVDITFP